MRISGGTSIGVILKVPAGLGVRPMPDRIRQAVFNSLGPRTEGARVLELFGGTGSLSFESLSRGAAAATCVEKSRKHSVYIRRNFEMTRLPANQLQLRTGDAFMVVPQLRQAGEQFDLIFADPPYGEKTSDQRSNSLAQRMLDLPDLPALLSGPEALLILGHARRDGIDIPKQWREIKILKHGDSWIRFLGAA